jgi:hypothetical protein
MTTSCPKRASADVRFRAKLRDWICEDCGNNWSALAPVEPPRALRIFLFIR